MKCIITLCMIFVFSAVSYAAELTIGLIPEQNVFKQVKRYEPLGDYIQKKTGTKIKFTILTRYGNIIENFHMQKLDGAFWGSFTGAMAIKKLDIEPIARPVNLDGTSTYHGYILVRKNSGIKNFSDMKGKKIAFVERATTAGYIYPMAYFKERGLTSIDSYFKEYYFTGSHDAAVSAVLNMKVDIACAKNTIFDLLAREDPEVREKLDIISESPVVPSNGLGIRKAIAFEVKAKIKELLLEMNHDPEGQEVLKNFGALKFIETKKSDYQPVFDIAGKAGITFENYEYFNK